MRIGTKIVSALSVIALVMTSLGLSSPAAAEGSAGEISVRAYGVDGSEIIELQLNNKIVAKFRLSKTMKTYTYVVPSKLKVDKLRVYYRNDSRQRDVNINYVALNGKRHESEARTTWSVGDYVNGSCNKGRNSTSQWLRCNGYFKYTSAEGTVLNGNGAAPPAPTPKPPTPKPVPPKPPVTPTPNPPVANPPASQPTPPQPGKKIAGNNGLVGCRKNCTTLRGVQRLDGRQGVVLENKIITNPGGRCLTVRNANNITIRNVTFKDCGTKGEVSDGYDTGLILIESSANVTIENSLFTNMGSVSSIDKRNNALQIENSPNTRVINSEFLNIRSDISQKSGDKGNRAIVVRGNNSHNIKIKRNDFHNPGRNAVQIIRVRGVRGVEIANNRIEGRGPWDSDFEDMINLYSSSGTPTSNIAIRGNYMRNGGPSNTGTAMILGDGSKSVGPSQYITVEDNVIVDSGHVGISLAGGDHITIRNNKVYSNRNVPGDRKNTVGFVMHHFNYSNRCFANTVTGNRVYQKNQLMSSGVNHVWDTKDCGVQKSGNVWGDRSLNYGIWALD